MQLALFEIDSLAMIQKIRKIALQIFYISGFLAFVACRNSGINIATTELNFTPKPTYVPGDTADSAFLGLSNKAAVSNFYRSIGHEPVWFQNDGYRELADSMLFIIRNASYYGFAPGNHHLAELEHSPGAATVRKELLLTDAFLSFAADLKFGLRKSKQKGLEDSLRIELLREVVTGESVVQILESQEPRFKGYQLLKERIRVILDSAQKYNVDSVSTMEKIRLISINMERWRRESSAFNDRYIFINIPSFKLELVDNDSTILSSKVIVGKPETATPVLSSVVECFTIYPYWHVPRGIAIEEYLPILKNDTSFLSRNHFDVLDRKGNVLNPDSVSWKKFNANFFPVVLRQREGPENALGIIKFIFDNPYAVYLHDTNAKRLFNRTNRALSHGCIRMEKAVQLAHYLVTGSVNAESKTISKYLNEKQRRWVDLKNPIPIYTRYFTCGLENGVLTMYKDIYNEDEAISELIFGPAGQPAL